MTLMASGLLLIRELAFLMIQMLMLIQIRLPVHLHPTIFSLLAVKSIQLLR
jgi:hypothetical protein